MRCPQRNKRETLVDEGATFVELPGVEGAQQVRERS